jgi:hypothetical protein
MYKKSVHLFSHSRLSSCTLFHSYFIVTKERKSNLVKRKQNNQVIINKKPKHNTCEGRSGSDAPLPLGGLISSADDILYTLATPSLHQA